jgi:hypothetical protein
VRHRMLMFCRKDCFSMSNCASVSCFKMRNCSSVSSFKIRNCSLVSSFKVLNCAVLTSSSLVASTKCSGNSSSGVLEKGHDRDENPDQAGILSTICGQMSDDGFTIVQRKYRKKIAQDKTKSNGHRTKRLSKETETAKANEGNEHKRGQKHSVMMRTAHYI